MKALCPEAALILLFICINKHKVLCLVTFLVCQVMHIHVYFCCAKSVLVYHLLFLSNLWYKLPSVPFQTKAVTFWFIISQHSKNLDPVFAFGFMGGGGVGPYLYIMYHSKSSHTISHFPLDSPFVHIVSWFLNTYSISPLLPSSPALNYFWVKTEITFDMFPSVTCLAVLQPGDIHMASVVPSSTPPSWNISRQEVLGRINKVLKTGKMS